MQHRTMELMTMNTKLSATKRLRSTLIAGALLFAWGEAASAADAVVKIVNFTFAPQTLTVPVGTAVTWQNDDHVPHVIVEKGGMFRSKTLDAGDKFTQQFTTTGTVEYVCSFHPHMTGKIVVTP
jgi:plastocyanin